MNVDTLVAKWVPVVRGIAGAHSRKEVDQCEFELDECLSPLLMAPVAQIREFWGKLCVALEADPEVPFYCWSMFKAWGEAILKDAPDAEIKKLRTDLAEEVATLVEEKVKPDWHSALVGALKWRAPEDLDNIKTAVKKGGRPRVVGRESCLFLEIHVPEGTPEVDHEDPSPMARVML